MSVQRILLVPLDPVHDVGIKLIRNGLAEAGHETTLLPPDLTVDEVIERALQGDYDCILLSRTMGYGVMELLARFIELIKSAGIRDRVKLGVGGMAIRPEVVDPLGFNGSFGPGTTVEEAVAFVEDRPVNEAVSGAVRRNKPQLTAGFSYRYGENRMGSLLDGIAREAVDWAACRTTAALQRAQLRQSAFRQGDPADGFRLSGSAKREYAMRCSQDIRDYYAAGHLPERVRRIRTSRLEEAVSFCLASAGGKQSVTLHHQGAKPVVLVQYGTGSPLMDITHLKVAEAWGAEGVIHFDPAWGARSEGLLEGCLSFQGDGTVITPDNIRLLRSALLPETLFQVRAHRGLNTPETVVIAGEAGADLTKINIAYGSLGGGTDPERLTVDGIAAMTYAAQYGLPYDIVTNEELCGVPAYKAFAGMLIGCALGRLTGGSPILQPLFCHSPEAMLKGRMSDNYIDFNAAKIQALRCIIDAPIWPGAPLGFMTHTEDRVQSSVTTSLHAALAASLQVDAMTIASSDEAYSGGTISAQARVDTLRGVKEALRFLGHGHIAPTAAAQGMSEQLIEQIERVLEQVRSIGFVDSLYRGVLGSTEEGAYPGRAGKGSVETAIHY
ncbi:cobalamin B12-binding domain-containing protein [Paenibacillus sp. UNC451MF]|uniref:cobalamin B12-binding domain-containing protein n=1 Tax=Paenibacillus sp. UNC451MF TaxID=1449063 RepID=UPI000491EB9C|nr:cobalamin-dependent protein [Paenibacillus sp. UNC451MF]